MYEIIFFLVFCSYLISSLFFITVSFIKSNKLYKYALFFSISGFFTHSGALIIRAFIAGFPPMSNLYESLSLLAWAIVLVFLIIECRYCVRALGGFIMSLACLSMAAASLMDSSIMPLMPALQSFWLFIHVITCFLSYACFACAFSLGIMYLLQERQVKNKHAGKIFERLPSLDIMDKINYQAVQVGFVFLTAGIITGSVWAQKAWGSWWSWDPKETWALVTWLIYAAALHARIKAGIRGRKAAIFSVLGFIAVLFTYLGVNFLFAGLHSYL